MYRAQVLTEWVLEEGRWEMLPWTLNVPCSVADATGQPAEQIPPDPNAVVVDVLAEESALDAIVADPRVTELWREEVLADE
jgi:hypothetical protein